MLKKHTAWLLFEKICKFELQVRMKVRTCAKCLVQNAKKKQSKTDNVPKANKSFLKV